MTGSPQCVADRMLTEGTTAFAIRRVSPRMFGLRGSTKTPTAPLPQTFSPERMAIGAPPFVSGRDEQLVDRSKGEDRASRATLRSP